MRAELQAHIAFHLTGRLSQGEVGALVRNDLYPAVLAGYRDLTALRYDFPVVLTRAGGDGQSVRSLSGLVDRALNEMAADATTERVRKHAVRLEREIRKLVAEGTRGSLSELWDSAAARIGAKNDKLLQDSLRRLRSALKSDGEVIDCDKAMPFRLFRHAWCILQDRKNEKFRANIDKLIMKLSNILSADFVNSKEGLSADRLRASIGAVHRDVFDFDAMSRLLGEAATQVPMPESRRARVRSLLSALRAQRFFAHASDGDKWIGAAEPYGFAIEKCSEAVAAYRERMPKMIELAKTMAVAQLEAAGEYSETRHDAFFAEFGANGLDPEDIALFPDYLICLHAAELQPADGELILAALAAGMPAKVVLQTDDLLEPSPLGGEMLMSGVRNRQLTGAAIGTAAYFVLQSSSAGLLRLREEILRGLAFSGPALFSVYSGASGGDIAPYLMAAAAAESRAFPAFTYDPSAGSDWASRFSLKANEQSDLDWPVQRLDYEDEEQQRISETVAFTLVDFAACDPRCAKHFAKVPRAKWNVDMVPVAEFLTPEAEDLSEKVPCLSMVDGDSRLQKVIVNDKLVREARACAQAWRSLQELGGIHNSHAAILVERERKGWAEQSRVTSAAAETQTVAPIAATVPAPVVASAPSVAEAAPEKPSDDPYIETARCTSCNECTQINDKMFGYDANKQASIVNPDAGTYRQLVEAAENCQISIVHPGKPRNAKESGLDELIKRAEPFM